MSELQNCKNRTSNDKGARKLFGVECLSLIKILKNKIWYPPVIKQVFRWCNSDFFCAIF